MNRFLAVGSASALAGVVAGVLIVLGLIPRDDFCDPKKNPKNHCFVVSVDAPTNTIVVNPDPLGKHGAGHKFRWIIFNTPSQQFTFPVNGIAFPRDPNFHCDPDPHLFECHDDPVVIGEHKYTVTLAGGPPTPKPSDPIIIDN